jgi:hypothetical protein
MKSPIPLPRFSLKTLFIAVLGVAIAITALKFANPIWASSLFTLLLVVLFAGFLGAVFGRAERRVFCAGLVLSGLGYLMAVYGPWFDSHVSGHLATTHLLGYLHGQFQESVTVPATPAPTMGTGSMTISPGMGGMKGKREAAMGGGMGADMGGMGGMAGGGMGGMAGGGMGGMGGMAGGGGMMPAQSIMMVVGPSRTDLMRVGHSLFGFLLALMGGALARWIWLKRHEDENQPLRAAANT